MPLTSSSSPKFGPRYRGGASYGPSYSKTKKKRGPTRYIILLLVIVLAVGGGFYEKKRRSDHAALIAAQLQAAAVVAVDSYVTAWSKGDYATAVSYVDPPEQAGAMTLLTATQTQLHATAFAVATQGPVTSVQRKLGPALGGGYMVTATIRGLGPVHWAGAVPLVLRAGVWKVAFTPALVEPALTTGGKFVYERDANNGSRGKVLMDDGTSMAINQPDLTVNLRGQVIDHLKTDADAAKLGPLYLAGDQAGTDGLEKAFNTKLQGTPGGSLTVVNAAGKVVQTLISLTKVAGVDVKTTLDPKTQAAAEAGLASVSAPAGSIVAMDLTTGQILALANKPIGGEVRTLTPYPPGSTFKIVTSVAALAAGYGPGTSIDCEKTVNIDGRTLKNSENEAFGTIGFAQAFAVSCNTWFAQLAVMVQKTKPGLLVKTAQEFGFQTGAGTLGHTEAENGILPIPGFGGSYPTPKDDAQVAGQSFGQDLVEASPLQMASVVAGAATGTWRQPILTANSPQAKNVLPAGTSATLRSFMAGVVSGDGTAAGVAFPSGTIGKTGTAETGNSKDDSWFVGINGNIAFAAEFDAAGFGADVAAPACAAFLRALGV